MKDSDYATDYNHQENRVPHAPDHLDFPDGSDPDTAPSRVIDTVDEAQEWIIPVLSAGLTEQQAREIANDDRIVKGNARGHYRFVPTGYVATQEIILPYVHGWDARDNTDQ